MAHVASLSLLLSKKLPNVLSHPSLLSEVLLQSERQAVQNMSTA